MAIQGEVGIKEWNAVEYFELKFSIARRKLSFESEESENKTE